MAAVASYMADRESETVSLDAKFIASKIGPADGLFADDRRKLGMPAPMSAHETVIRSWEDHHPCKAVAFGDDVQIRIEQTGHAQMTGMKLVIEWPDLSAGTGLADCQYVNFLGHAALGHEDDARHLTIRHSDLNTLREMTGTYLHLFTLLNLEAHSAESDRVREAAGELQEGDDGTGARTTIVDIPLFGTHDIAHLGNAFLSASTTRGLELQFRLPSVDRLTRAKDVAVAQDPTAAVATGRTLPAPKVYIRAHYADYTGPSRSFLVSQAFTGSSGEAGGIKRFVLDNERVSQKIAAEASDADGILTEEISLRPFKKPCAYLAVVQRWASDLLPAVSAGAAVGSAPGAGVAFTGSSFNPSTENPAPDMFAFIPLRSWAVWENNRQFSPKFTAESWSRSLFTLNGFNSSIDLHKKVGIVPFCEDVKSVNGTGSVTFSNMSVPSLRIEYAEHPNAITGQDQALHIEPALRAYPLDVANALEAGALVYADDGAGASQVATLSGRRFDVFSICRNVYENRDGNIKMLLR